LNRALEGGRAFGREATIMRLIDALLYLKGLVRHSDDVVEVGLPVRLATATAGGCTCAGDDDPVLAGNDLDRLDVRDVQVAAQNEIHSGLGCRVERILGIPGDVVPPQRADLGEVMM